MGAKDRKIHFDNPMRDRGSDRDSDAHWCAEHVQFLGPGPRGARAGRLIGLLKRFVKRQERRRCVWRRGVLYQKRSSAKRAAPGLPCYPVSRRSLQGRTARRVAALRSVATLHDSKTYSDLT